MTEEAVVKNNKLLQYPSGTPRVSMDTGTSGRASERERE